MTKKKIAIIITSIILAAALVTAGVFVGRYIYYSIPGEWKAVDGIDEYEGIFDSEFVSITLENDLYNITFSDEDLIEIWSDYLTNIKIRREDNIAGILHEVSGGEAFITVKTENGAYQFSLFGDDDHDTGFEIDRCYYAIDSDDEVPYTETYALATERHGKYQNWDGEWVE